MFERRRSEFGRFSRSSANFSCEAGVVLNFFASFFGSSQKRKWGLGAKPLGANSTSTQTTKPIAENQTDSGGIGLGLAIAIGLIKLLGGKIDVESVPGKGSTFFIIIPV